MKREKRKVAISKLFLIVLKVRKRLMRNRSERCCSVRRKRLMRNRSESCCSVRPRCRSIDRKRKREASIDEENEDGWSSDDIEEGWYTDNGENGGMNPVEKAKFHQQVRDSSGFDVDDFDYPFGGIRPIRCIPSDALLGKVGLHCFNAHKGTNLQFKTVTKVNAQVVSFVNYFYTLEAIDPINNSPITIQTCVYDAAPRNNEKLRLFTTSCWIKGSQEKASLWDKNAVEGFYTGLMPTWLELDNALRGGSNELHYYEVKESDVQENEWLHLYAQVAAYSEWNIDMEDHFPLELEKVVVRTNGYVEPSVSKVKCSNAIFYIVFKTCEGLKHSAVIRQTVDGRPGHISLEVTNEVIDN